MNSMQRMENQILEIVDEAQDWADRNRANAQHSTGPRSPYGKSRSSSNSLKHGLTAKTVVLPGEDQAEFDALQDSLMADYNPMTEHETQLVSEIAACLWRLSRARRHEEHALASDFTLFSRNASRTKGFERLVRYMGSIERQLNSTTVRLQQLQSERRKVTEKMLKTTPEEKPKVMSAAAGNSHPFSELHALSGFVLSNAKPAGTSAGSTQNQHPESTPQRQPAQHPTIPQANDLGSSLQLDGQVAA